MLDKIDTCLPRKLLLSIVAGLSATLAVCSDEPRPAPPVKLLATDVHVAIGGAKLTLPFAALEDYAYRRMSFSLDQRGDPKRAREAVDDLIRNTRDSDNPLVLRDLSIVVRPYGWNDVEMRQQADVSTADPHLGAIRL